MPCIADDYIFVDLLAPKKLQINRIITEFRYLILGYPVLGQYPQFSIQNWFIYKQTYPSWWVEEYFLCKPMQKHGIDFWISVLACLSRHNFSTWHHADQVHCDIDSTTRLCTELRTTFLRPLHCMCCFTSLCLRSAHVCWMILCSHSNYKINLVSSY